MGYQYEFHFFGSMFVGIDMEGSDRDVNVQPTQRLPVSLHDWMKMVARVLKTIPGVTEVEECAWKDTVETKILGNWVDVMFSFRRTQRQEEQSQRLKELLASWREAGRLAGGRAGRQEGHGRKASKGADRQTDGQADGRTAGQTDRQTSSQHNMRGRHVQGAVVLDGRRGCP